MHGVLRWQWHAGCLNCRSRCNGYFMRKTITTAAIAAMILTATAALAGPTPEQKCEATKNSVAGKYAACRQSAEKGLATTEDATKYDAAIVKCETKFAEAWQKAIDKAADAATTCPDAPLVSDAYKSVIDSHTGNIATALAGGGLPTPSTCGNGTIESGEDCDFGTIGGQTCSTATAGVSPYGTLDCGVGCAFDDSGCFGCPGTIFNGSCWVLGAEGASCVNVCTSRGMTYDPATAYAGSTTSCGACLSLAQTMFPNYTSPPYPAPLQVQATDENGFGCAVFNLPTLVCDRATTTGDAVHAQMERLCACH